MKRLFVLLLVLILVTASCKNQGNTVTITKEEYEKLKNNSSNDSIKSNTNETITEKDVSTNVISDSLDGYYDSIENGSFSLILDHDKYLFFHKDAYNSSYAVFDNSTKKYVFPYGKDTSFATIDKIGDNIVLTIESEGNDRTYVFSKTKDINPLGGFLDGDYILEYSNSTLYLTKEGNKLLLTTNTGESEIGDIDESKKTIKWQGGTDEFTYEIIGDRIAFIANDKKSVGLTFHAASSEEIKAAREKDAENAKYKYLGEYDHLSSQEYTVGTDIKPGEYSLRYDYMDYDDDDSEKEHQSTASITITDQGKDKVFTFKDNDEKVFNLKEGQVMTIEMMGDDSYMTLDSVN